MVKKKYLYYFYFKYCYYFCFSPGYKVILLRSIVHGVWENHQQGAPTITIFSNYCPRSGTVFFYKVVTIGKHILLILSTIHYWLEACVVITNQVPEPTC